MIGVLLWVLTLTAWVGLRRDMGGGLAATPPPTGLMFGEDRKGDDFCHPLFFGELAKIYSL